MDTPLAISAVTDVDIVNKGIEDLQTLYQSIPGLSYRSNSGTWNTLSVRGLTPPAAGGGATVGVYFDSMPITDATHGGLSQVLGPLFDLERLEVLKGPQGTLYGEGAMGGSIRYITKRPDPSGFDYSAHATVEDIAETSGLSYRVDAMVNIPLGDRFAARIVGYRRDRVGLLDHVAPRGEEDVDYVEETGGRIRLSWYPSDAVEISALVNVVDGDYGGPGLGFHCYTESTRETPLGQVPVYLVPGTRCAGFWDQFDRDPYVTHIGHRTWESGGFDDLQMYNFSIDWELPFANFHSSTSWFKREADWAEEVSPRFFSLFSVLTDVYYCFGMIPGCGPGKFAAAGGDGVFYRSSERFVQELRLVSNQDSPWQWTLGGYYRDDESQKGRHTGCYNGGPAVYDTIDTHCWFQLGFFPDVPIAEQAGMVLFLNGILAGNTNYLAGSEHAVFGEVSYAFNDAWELLVGARYAEVTNELLVAPAAVDSKSNPVNDLDVTTRINSPKVTLTWRPKTDWMLYFTYSQGFRPGIVNTSVASKIAELTPILGTDPRAQAYYDTYVGLQTADGDEVVNYEFGIKATVAGERVSFTGSLYQIDWNDTIVSFSSTIGDVVGVAPTPFLFANNEGSAESQGLELEVRAALTENLSLAVGGDWNWTAEIHSAAGGRYGVGVDIVPGNRLASAPKYSAYLSLAYDFRLAGFDANARLDAYSIDDFWDTANNEAQTPGYETVDLKVVFGRDNWQVGAYVRNVANETIVYELNPVGFRFGRPRTLGLQFSYNL